MHARTGYLRRRQRGRRRRRRRTAENDVVRARSRSKSAIKTSRLVQPVLRTVWLLGFDSPSKRFEYPHRNEPLVQVFSFSRPRPFYPFPVSFRATLPFSSFFLFILLPVSERSGDMEDRSIRREFVSF